MKFYGRKEELNKLSRQYEADDMRVVLIYGRRRVGKSELIKQSIKQSSAQEIYYICKQTPESINVSGLAEVISEAFHLPPLSFASIEEELEYIFKKSIEQKIVLVLDEYTYLREKTEGMDSILQSLIDRYKDSSHLKLVVCSSYVDSMKYLLQEENPLYGRVDLSINLKQMDYYDSALFYPSFSDEDKIRIYSVFGGIPYYNRLIDPSKSVKENIIELIASSGARLEDEVQSHLRSEISKISNANAIFLAMSKGYSRYSDILSQSQISSSPTLSDVLEKLTDMEIVIKEAPINAPNNKKKTGYYINDNMSIFYYRYINRYGSQMNVMHPNAFYDRYIAEDFESQYVPNRFEGICKQYLIRLNRKESVNNPFTRIGKFYYDNAANHTNGEFDIVTEDNDGYIFYEAKFTKKAITAEIIENEIEQVKASGLNCTRFGFFSRSGYSNTGNSNVIQITLKDLYL